MAIWKYWVVEWWVSFPRSSPLGCRGAHYGDLSHRTLLCTHGYPWLLPPNDFQANLILYSKSVPWVPCFFEGELVHSYAKNHADRYHLFLFQSFPHRLSMHCDWYIETICPAAGWVHFGLFTGIMIGLNWGMLLRCWPLAHCPHMLQVQTFTATGEPWEPRAGASHLVGPLVCM
jgi:hypothetical protein